MGFQLTNADDWRRTFRFFDDFFTFDEAERWTTTADAGGSQDLDSDGVCGVLRLATGSTDNDEAYVESTRELFLFADDKALTFEARVKYSEANTDDANILIGLEDAPGADSLQDDGAGPKASYSGFNFHKVDGGTAWNFESSIGSRQTTTEIDGETPGRNAYPTMCVEV